MGAEKATRTRSTAQATAEGLRVFVAGVPWKIGEDTLRRDFEECGIVEDLFLLKDQDGNSRGRCFITFREKTAVAAALKYDNTEYGGRTIYVKLAERKPNGSTTTEKAEKGPAKEKVNSKTSGVPAKASADSAKSFPQEKPDGCVSVCLKGIGEATEANVRKLLKGCCVQSVRIVTDRATGQPRGIAFVDFPETAEVDKAMKFNGKMMNGQEVKMHYEAPRVRPRPDGCLCVAVRKLTPEVSEDDLRELFKGLKSIEEVRIIRDKEQACIGYAFVEFGKPADVEAAVRRDGMAVNGQTVFICYETKQKKTRAASQQGADKKTTKVKPDDSTKASSAAPESQEQPKKVGKKRKRADSQTAALLSDQTVSVDVKGQEVMEEAPTATKKKKKKQTNDQAVDNADVQQDANMEGSSIKDDAVELNHDELASGSKKKRRGQPRDRKRGKAT